MICLLFWLRFEPSVSKHGGKTKTLNAGGRTRSEAVGPSRFYVLFNKFLKTLWTHRLLVHNLGDHALKDVVEVKTEDEPIVQYFWMAALDWKEMNFFEDLWACSRIIREDFTWVVFEVFQVNWGEFWWLHDLDGHLVFGALYLVGSWNRVNLSFSNIFIFITTGITWALLFQPWL